MGTKASSQRLVIGRRRCSREWFSLHLPPNLASEPQVIKTYFVLMVLLGMGFWGMRYAFVHEIKQYFDGRMYVAVAAILAAGFTIHNALLFNAIAAGALLIIASSRTDALCRMVVLVCVIPDVAQYIIIGSLTVTVTGTPSLLSLAALIACYARKGPQPFRQWTAEDSLVVVLIICFGIMAQRHANFTGLQRTTFTMALGLGLPYFTYRRCLQGPKDFGHFIATLAGAAVILAFLGIFEAKTHWPIYDAIYSNQYTSTLISTSVKVRGGLLRAPASFGDSTAFAIFEAIGVFAIISSRRYFRNGLLWWGSIAMAVLGLLAAQSRGADVGLLFGLFLMLAIRRRYAAAIAAAAGGATLVALLLALAPASPTIAAFIGADVRASTGDQDYRQTLLRRGVEVGMEHPILGNDLPFVIAEMSDLTQGEGIVDIVNTYLTIFLVSGLAGLGLLATFLSISFLRMFSASRKKSDEFFNNLNVFAAGAMAAGWVALTFTSFIYERNAYWMMMLLACCRGLAYLPRVSSDQVPRERRQVAAGLALGGVHRWQTNPILDPA